jgi:hypothetical protein
MSKRGNHLRVQAAAVTWGDRGARSQTGSGRSRLRWGLAHPTPRLPHLCS